MQPWGGPFMGRVRPFCQDCQEADWRDEHSCASCRCVCHVPGQPEAQSRLLGGRQK